MQKKICFFTTSGKNQILNEQYSIQDINILKELGYSVIIASKFNEIPWDCDLYFSWWTSGSLLPFIVSTIVRKPIIVVAGGNEAMLYRDSITNKPKGYLATPWYKKMATRITLKFSTKVFIVSEFMRNDVRKLGAKNPILVYNSINVDQFIPKDIKRTEVTTIFKIDKDVVELKRGYILLQAIPLVIEKYPDQIFTFIGEFGNAYDDFISNCEELGISSNIRFTNKIPNEEVVNWMQKSKLYVQISDTETFGVGIAEALSCETHVVVSKRGAISEVVGDLGIYVDQNNPLDVAKGIIKVLDLTDKDREIIGSNLRNRMLLLFPFKKRKKEIKEIIESII
jgi:glycosyltransferase involved in cell wall biosynthesis